MSDYFSPDLALEKVLLTNKQIEGLVKWFWVSHIRYIQDHGKPIHLSGDDFHVWVTSVIHYWLTTLEDKKAVCITGEQIERLSSWLLDSFTRFVKPGDERIKDMENYTTCIALMLNSWSIAEGNL